MTAHLVHLIDLAKEPSSTKRRELLREVTSVFMAQPEDVSEAEMSLYDEVMSHLSDEMETMVRAEIAQKLSTSKTAPLGLLRKLASDDFSVAEPILLRSKNLSETDLLHVVSTQGQDHLRAVSKREEVSESVSGVIVKRGDDATLNTLLSNDKAKLSRASNEAVVERALVNPALHSAVVGRKDLPIDLMNDMYFVVEARLRERILKENAAMDPDLLDQALSQGRQKVAMNNGSLPQDYLEAEKEIDYYIQNQKLTPALLAKYMRHESPTYFLLALSRLADIDYLTAKHLVDKREIDALAIACKAADLDKSLFLTYVMIMLSSQSNAMGKAAEYGKLYENLPKETATRTIRFWRMRRVESQAA
jgi:uncharacterized protein (DUF2336 family)